jgi:hypothetical protein
MQGDGYGMAWHWFDVVWCMSSREPLATFDLGLGRCMGGFALDAGWRQVRHRVRTIRWRHGQMVPVDHGATGASGLD